MAAAAPSQPPSAAAGRQGRRRPARPLPRPVGSATTPPGVMVDFHRAPLGGDAPRLDAKECHGLQAAAHDAAGRHGADAADLEDLLRGRWGHHTRQGRGRGWRAGRAGLRAGEAWTPLRRWTLDQRGCCPVLEELQVRPSRAASMPGGGGGGSTGCCCCSHPPCIAKERMQPVAVPAQTLASRACPPANRPAGRPPRRASQSQSPRRTKMGRRSGRCRSAGPGPAKGTASMASASVGPDHHASRLGEVSVRLSS